MIFTARWSAYYNQHNDIRANKTVWYTLLLPVCGRRHANVFLEIFAQKRLVGEI